MDHFMSQRTLRHRPEYKHLVKQYNETGIMLMRFELNIQVIAQNMRLEQIISS